MKLRTILIAAVAAGVVCSQANAQVVQWRGNGALTSGSSATITSLITSNAQSSIAYSALSGTTGVGNLSLINDGTTDAAVCPNGGTCTCPENGVAATNGITLRAYGGGYGLSLLNVSYPLATVVACSGTPIVEANW